MSRWIDYLIYFVVVIISSTLLGVAGFLGSVIVLNYILSYSKPSEPKNTQSIQSYSDTAIEDTSITSDIIQAMERECYYNGGALRVPQDMYTEYRAYLKTDRWKAISATVKRRDNHRCTRCNHIGYLQVHHTHYRGIYEDFNFQVDQLETVCNLCHKDIHNNILPMSKD